MRYFRSATLAIWLLASLILLTTPTFAWDQSWSSPEWRRSSPVTFSIQSRFGGATLPLSSASSASRTIYPDYIPTVRAHASARRTDLAGQHADKLARQFSYTQQRLSGVIARLSPLISSQISGSQVSLPRRWSRPQQRLARQQLTVAQAKLTLGAQAADEAVRAFRAITPAPLWEQRDQAFAARDFAMQARDNFRHSRLALLQAVRLLRA